MRVNAAFVAVALVCGSASVSAQDVPTPVPSAVHAYKFSAIHAGKKIIEGVLTDYADSMVVTSEWARCKPQASTPDSANFARFKCSGAQDIDGLSLSFERAAPRNATWTGTPKRMPFKVVAVCSSGGGSSKAGGSNCTGSSNMPVGLPTRTDPTVTDKLKVSEKK